jgi:hypothetical protein
MNVNDKLGDLKVLATSVNSMIQALMEVVASLIRTSRAVQSLQPGADQLHDGADDVHGEEQCE